MVARKKLTKKSKAKPEVDQAVEALSAVIKEAIPEGASFEDTEKMTIELGDEIVSRVLEELRKKQR